MIYMSRQTREMDMINGKLAPNILKFALPLAATGILQQLFNAADVAVIGRFAGKEAMAAVGSNGSIIGLLVNMFVGIALGANVVIAHATGQGDDEKVSKTVHTSIVVAVIGGIFMTIIGEIIASPLISVMGVPPEVRSMSILYLRIYLSGMAFSFLYNFEAAILRSQGNTRLPMVALTIAGVINVILNLIFVIGFGLDVAGVALATVISNVVSSGILLVYLKKAKGPIRVYMSKLRVDRDVLIKVLRIGVPSGIQGMVFSLSNVVIQSAINSLGATIMAASSAAFNLEIIAYYVLNSYSQACTTFVGQNFGAGKYDRCKRVLQNCALLSMVSTAIVCSGILLASHELLALFNTDPEVIEVGAVRLQIIFVAYIFTVLQEAFTGYLRGFGMSFIPALVTVVGICGTRLLWVFTIFNHMPTFNVLMGAYPVSLGLTAFIIWVIIMIVKPSKRYANKTAI